MRNTDPYKCPACGLNLPEEHGVVGDYDAWQCPNGKLVWIYTWRGPDAWHYGTKAGDESMRCFL